MLALLSVKVCLGESPRHHSTVLSHSSSESSLPTLGESINDAEFLKWEMWARSKIPSSSTSMMGMSKLQKESVRVETEGKNDFSDNEEAKTRQQGCTTKAASGGMDDNMAKTKNKTSVQENLHLRLIKRMIQASSSCITSSI